MEVLGTESDAPLEAVRAVVYEANSRHFFGGIVLCTRTFDGKLAEHVEIIDKHT